MLRKALFSAVAMVAGTGMIAYAGAKDDVVAAAKKVADGKNYTWRTTTESAGGFQPGPQEGKTDKGTTMISMSFGDNDMQIVRQGDKAAMKTPDGWMSMAEMQQQQQGGGGRGPGMFMMNGQQQDPATQAAEALDKLPDLQKNGDVYTATVTGDAMRNFMPFGRGGRRGGGQGGQAGQGGGQGPQIQNGKATVKIWLKEGMLSKYEVATQGTINFNGEDRDISSTRTTEIKDVGTTKVQIPAEAKAKLQ